MILLVHWDCKLPLPMVVFWSKILEMMDPSMPKDPLWETPLLTAAHIGHLKLVKILLEAGAQRRVVS